MMNVEALRAKNKSILPKDILISVFLFVTFAFCKAGAVIKGAPVTVSTVLCAAVVLCMLRELLRYVRVHMGISIYYFLYVLFVLSNTALHIGQLSVKDYLFPLVVAASPLMYVIGMNIEYDRCLKILCVSGIIVGLYSVIQWLFGLTQTTIPGITLALGDAWANKPIGYGFTVLHESTKMPSTAQNGNNIALLSVLGIGALLCWTPQKKWFLAKWVSIGLYVVALVLSGSRSATYPFATLLPVGMYGCWKQYKDTDKKCKRALMLTILITVVFTVLLLQIPQLTTNYGRPDLQDTDILSFFQSPTESSRLIQEVGSMSGRTDAWRNMIQRIGNEYRFCDRLRLIIVGAPDADMMMGGEGLPLFITQYGVISAILFMGFFIPLLKIFTVDPIFVWSGLSFAGALVVDSSYNYPPVLIWFFILQGIMIAKNCSVNVSNMNL